MTNKITIVEAIKQVLKTSTVGMTSQEIYNEIVQRKLYCFGAKTPEAVVHGKLRIHCKDLDFPTASPTKYFYLKKRVGRKNYYALLGSENQEDNNVLIENEIENEMLAEEKMYKAYIQYSKELENNILERILHCKPEFFERLVVVHYVAVVYVATVFQEWVVTATLLAHVVQQEVGCAVIYLRIDREAWRNCFSRFQVICARFLKITEIQPVSTAHAA